VTIVERSTQVLQPFDADMAAFIHAKLRQSGVFLKLTRSVTGFRSDSDGIITDIENDSALRSDLVILALGVVPDTSLAKNAGLRLGQRGSIAVDEHMRTSDPDIYAVGDAVEIHHRVTDAQALVSLAGPANKQGRIAADNICGINTAYRGALGSTIIKLFAMTAAITGINEKTAAALGIAYDKIVLSPLSHASYYPDASVMTMKVLWEKNTHRLLGAQIIGFDAVDKRIDVLAAAIYAGLTADELQNLDLAYAPPYASAKDPVNMAGYIIDNILANRIEQFHCEDVERLPRDGRAILLDTRTPREYAMGHADGFINIPVDDLRVRLYELDPKKPVYVMCQSGLRSYIAVCILNHSGFKAYNFSGGYRFYQTVMQDRQFSEKSFPCGMEN
jgi:rhodanese-related sulfurtransferase